MWNVEKSADVSQAFSPRPSTWWIDGFREQIRLVQVNRTATTKEIFSFERDVFTFASSILTNVSDRFDSLGKDTARPDRRTARRENAERR